MHLRNQKSLGHSTVEKHFRFKNYENAEIIAILGGLLSQKKNVGCLQISSLIVREKKQPP